MTREEAIKILKEDGCGWCTWQSTNPYECENKECKLKEALKMAISAMLENEELSKDLDEALKEIDGYEQGIEQEPTFDDECQKDMDEAWEQIQKKRKRIPVTLDLTPCTDAVSREDALMCLTGMFKLNKNYNPEELIALFSKRIKALPSVTPKSGKWIEKDFRKEEYVLTGKCSVCGRVRILDKFCSYCGAKMEREDKEC